MTTGGDNETTLATLELLEIRLRKIDLYTGGTAGPQDLPTDGKEQSIQSRLQRVEDNFRRLISGSPAIGAVLDLCKPASFYFLVHNGLTFNR